MEERVEVLIRDLKKVLKEIKSKTYYKTQNNFDVDELYKKLDKIISKLEKNIENI